MSQRYTRIFLVGDDVFAKDRIINAIGSHGGDVYSQYWEQYRVKMQRLCVDLMCTIIKRGTPEWDMEHVAVLLAFSTENEDNRPSFSEAVDACAMLWWSSSRESKEPNPDSRGYLRQEKIKLWGIIVNVTIIPGGGVNIYCENGTAKL
jgi:hypothetical protein